MMATRRIHCWAERDDMDWEMLVVKRLDIVLARLARLDIL